MNIFPFFNVNADIRCKECHKLLAKSQTQVVDSLEIKCVRCGSLNSVFEKTTDQIIITDKEGIILYTNGALEEVTGYSQEEIIGARPSLWGNQMPKEFYKDMWDTIKNKKQSVKVTVTNKRKDGSFYTALLRISPMLNVQGDIQFFIGIETVLTDEAPVIPSSAS